MTTDNEAAAVEAASLEAFQNAMEIEHGYRPQLWATGVLMNSRDEDRFLGWQLAIAAHTAASAGEVAGWQRRKLYAENGEIPQWAQCSKEEATGHWDRHPRYEYRTVYTRTPAAVPADALERLVADWAAEIEMADENSADRFMRGAAIAQRKCRDELAALIPKGADRGQR